MQIRHYMDVVFHTVKAIKFTVLIFYYSEDVLIQFYFRCGSNCGLPVFCTENNLIKDLSVRAHMIVC